MSSLATNGEAGKGRIDGSNERPSKRNYRGRNHQPKGFSRGNDHRQPWRNRGNRQDSNIDSYVSGEMLGNPWSHLESSNPGTAILHQQILSAEVGEGTLAEEGLQDRPWN